MVAIEDASNVAKTPPGTSGIPSNRSSLPPALSEMATNISLHVREPTPARNEDDSDDDADDESSLSQPRKHYPYIPRRERSHSTVTNPIILASQLESISEPKIKRRSVSTCGPLSISPPTKTLRSDDDSMNAHPDLSPPISTLPTSIASTSSATKPPIIGGVRLRESRQHPRLSPHVRFSNIEDRAGQFRYPYLEAGLHASNTSPLLLGSGVTGYKRGSGRCHHLNVDVDDAKNLNNVTSVRPSASRAGDKAPPHIVQRTQSNPEMDSCPVCLARKECEILLKRTYSKV
ncbi:hypothetical protein TCAL_17143 [Tigriopus californicus]|uniref:Uncharacterized protein n=1 Tax=Tigriopus californicus TaxID=6832 RepID=A0A553P2N7_TIGCA|nr:hypothetical protein TCAL_17143 [Tigriopus californicus]